MNGEIDNFTLFKYEYARSSQDVLPSKPTIQDRKDALMAQSVARFMDRHPAARALIASSGVTREEIRRYTSSVRAEYICVNELLPNDHQWKGHKLAHADACAREVAEHATIFGLEGVERDVFEFILFCHDIGRLEQGRRRSCGETVLDEAHGALSVQLVRTAIGITDENITPLWTAVFRAIECHSFRVTPTGDELGDQRVALPLIQLLRDTDKLGGFDAAKDYTGDPARKARERRANWTDRIDADPSWGNELGLISPSYHLWERFLNGQHVVRKDCRSYEAYMLQLLAWCYDVNTPEMLQVIIDRGGPRTVYEYLVARLTIGSTNLESAANRDEAAHQLAALQKWAAMWMDGVLIAPKA